jgi:hypothetical protein
VELSQVVKLGSSPLREVDRKEVDERSNFITKEVHLDGQGRSYRVVTRTRRSPTAKWC